MKTNSKQKAAANDVLDQMRIKRIQEQILKACSIEAIGSRLGMNSCPK